MEGAAAGPLEGKSILVAEDEYVLARDLAGELTRRGALVVGPVANLAEARVLARHEKLDGAVIDIRLHDGLAFPFADELKGRNIPFVFATGLAPSLIPQEYRAVGLFQKPYDPSLVVNGLSSAPVRPPDIQFREYSSREMALWKERVNRAEAVFQELSASPDHGRDRTADSELLFDHMRSAIAAMRAEPGNLRLTVHHWSTRNQLLRGLAEKDFAVLAPFLVPCEREVGDTIGTEPGGPYVYFPETAIAAVFNHWRNNIDLGPVGFDGALGLAAVFGVSPFRFLVTQAGSFLRISGAELSLELRENQALRRYFTAYEIRRQAEIAEIARVNALRTVEQRVARYLLAYRARSANDQLWVTHAMLSEMLGVRRPGITDALHLIESSGAIRSTRGLVTIRNPALLLRHAGEPGVDDPASLT